MSYRPDIDGLRAIAVLSVLGFHAFAQFMPGGFVGVDIFFVISGFLISRIIFERLDSHEFSIADFYQRRVRRILPALLLVMAACMLAGWFTLFADEYAQLSRHVAAGAAFVLNFSLWQESGYFDNAAETKPLLHLWSLAVEEQFYLLWPIWLALLGRKAERRPFAILSLGLLSFCLNLYWSGKSASAAFYLPFTRFWELMLGATAAHLAMAAPPSGGTSAWSRSWAPYRDAISILGALLLACGWLLIDRTRAFPGYWALLPTIGAFLLIQAGAEAVVNRTVLRKPLLVAIGLISYPLYLWHWPVLTFLRIGTNGQASVGLTLFGLALSFVLAWLTYRLLEKRIRAAQGHRHVTPLLLSLASLALMGLAVKHLGGLPGRSIARQLSHQWGDEPGDGSGDPGLASRQDAFAGSRQSDGSCARQLGLSVQTEEICLTTSTKPTLLLAGDSHAMALYSPIFAKATKADAMLVAAHGCELYPELSFAPSYQKDWANNCTAVARRVLTLARSANSIKTIVLVNHYPPLDEGASSYRLGQLQLSKTQAFLDGLSPLIEQAQLAGKQVVFVLDVPFLKQDPKACIQRLPFLAVSECRYTLAEHQQLRRRYLDQVKTLKARHPKLIVYDPTPLFCPGQMCEASVNGHLLYNDANHISAYAAVRLLDQMRADKAIDF